MSETRTEGFTSLTDFGSKLVDFLKGPTLYSTFSTLDKRLIKKMMITVSIVNNCSQ